jgi:hypothetical protein
LAASLPSTDAQLVSMMMMMMMMMMMIMMMMKG